MIARRLSTLLSFPLVLGIPAGAQGAPAKNRPNIVLLVVDDWGWQDTSVPFGPSPTPLNSHFRTPHMERLASQGVLFTQAYAAPVCSPSRVSLLTGQSPVRHHVTNWTLRGETSGETPTLKAPADWKREGLQPGGATLASLLTAGGYATIQVGKAHFGGLDTPGADPRNLGFTQKIAGHAAGHPGSYQGEQCFGNQPPGTWTPPYGVPDLTSYHKTPTHLTDALTQEACQALEAPVKKGQPFFLYFAHYAVHTPLQEHRPLIDHYRGKVFPGTDLPIPEAEARYASMVEGVDRSLGALMSHLERLGIAQNTLIILTSDNGGLDAVSRGVVPGMQEGHAHNAPLREGKGSAYEGGIRVPLFVAFGAPAPAHPAQAKLRLTAGRREERPVIIEDLFPTVLSVAGLKPPAAHPVDGVSLLGPVLRERLLLFHYPHVWGPRTGGYSPHTSLRKGDWKAIYFFETRRWELYNLRDDLGETRNLAAAEPKRLSELAADMRRQHAKLGAQYPQNKATSRPEEPVWPPVLR